MTLVRLCRCSTGLRLARNGSRQVCRRKEKASSTCRQTPEGRQVLRKDKQSQESLQYDGDARAMLDEDWLFLALIIAFAAFFCMLVASRTRASRVQLPRVTPFVPRSSTRSDSTWLQRASANPLPQSSMFHRAVNAHSVNTAAAVKATSQQQRPISQQLFPSSSPTDGKAPSQQRPTQRQQVQDPLKPLPPNSINSQTFKRPASSLPAKRTSDGLARALGETGADAFQQPSSTIPGSYVPEDAGVVINENDFDSDLDLDIEDPAPKATVRYPKIPPKTTRVPKAYPPRHQKAHLHSETTRDFGYESLPPAFEEQQPPPSTNALPWSSSPDFHSRPPPQQGKFAAYSFGDQNTNKTAPPPATTTTNTTNAANDQTQRPPKRRTLPWLEAEAAAPTQPETTQILTKQQPLSSFTPASKVASRFPWNTTASAIKEQQKKLRNKTNKKAVKENAATDEALQEAIAKKKSKTVARPLLSKEQHRVLAMVVEEGNSIFFTGSAGTGKSVLLREIIAVLRKKYARESDRIAITASTGLAACNIGGVTLHSFAGIGLGKEEVPELVKKIKRNQKAKHRWMRTKVLVLDEVSMVDGDLFDKLEAIGRQLRNNGRPFGGIQLVITGDFFQLPPVPERGVASTFCFDAKSWTSAIDHTIGLHHVFRQKDPVFAGMLNEMREGRLSPSSIATFKGLSRTPEYANELGLTTTELFPTRKEVEDANSVRMRQLGGNPVEFIAKDGGTMAEEARSKLLNNSLAPQVLILKKGSQVMLIKNIDESLVNGSLGKVIGFMSDDQFGSYVTDQEACEAGDPEDLNPGQQQIRAMYNSNSGVNTRELWPVVRFSIADGTTRDLLCNREIWKTELPNGEITASRAQVPLILAWALSIHKAQGQTLERVKVDLGKVFEKGQAYVALSRATSIQGLQVLRFDATKVMAHPKVCNFYEGLSKAEETAKKDGMKVVKKE